MTSLPEGASHKRTQGMPSKDQPLVTLLWLNFNSMKNISLIFESLDSTLKQDYPNFELLVIDNASEDGSWEAVRDHVSSSLHLWPNVQVRFLRTEKNLGYNGGFDYGYWSMDPSSKYVAVISDDAVLSSDFLDVLTQELERDPSVGAIQGIVSTLDGKRIDSAGVLIDKLMIPHHALRGQPVEKKEKPIPVSFVEGTCPIYRVEALRKILPGHLFYPSGFFLYLEDNLNGLLLWNNGYRCITVHRVVARHKREAGGGGLLRTYCLWRNRTALMRLTDSRLKPLEYIFGAVSMIYLLSVGQPNKAKMLVKGMYDGYGLAIRMRREYGFSISMNKAPITYIRIRHKLRLLTGGGSIDRRDEIDL